MRDALDKADDGAHDTQPHSRDAQEDDPLVVGPVLDDPDIRREVGVACGRGHLVEGVDGDGGKEGAVLDDALGHERLGREVHLEENVRDKQHKADDEHSDDASVGPAPLHGLRDREGQEDEGERHAEDDKSENIDINQALLHELQPVAETLRVRGFLLAHSDTLRSGHSDHAELFASLLHSIQREDGRYKQDRHHDGEHTQAPSPIVDESVANEAVNGHSDDEGDREGGSEEATPLQGRQVTDDDVAQQVEAGFTDRGEAHADRVSRECARACGDGEAHDVEDENDDVGRGTRGDICQLADERLADRPDDLTSCANGCELAVLAESGAGHGVEDARGQAHVEGISKHGQADGDAHEPEQDLARPARLVQDLVEGLDPADTDDRAALIFLCQNWLQ